MAAAPKVALASACVNLQVGERHFTTSKDTLVRESAFFASLLANHTGSSVIDADTSSYFIDADPNLFEHILSFLRRGIFPLCFDAARGHNHALYASLLQEARHFQIARLESWLVEKRYLEAVKMKCTITTFADEEAINGPFNTLSSDTLIEFYPSWISRQVYLCPRKIPVHKDKPEQCGKLCHIAQGDDPIRYDEIAELHMLTVLKSTIVDHEMLLASA